jgi:8-oxo-dGTP pyrophosphatase MutT (NUDIX family)
MSVRIREHKIHINLTIPLPCKYRGGGVAVFRVNGGNPEVLLGLRANNPGRGRWTFPGGGAEGGERLAEAAVREFREETGVQLYGRYITKTGVFSINSFFFEWNTLIIESAQKISPDKYFNESLRKEQDLIDRELVFLRWVPVAEIGNYKLHRWVKEVVSLYLSGKLKPYKANPPKKAVRDPAKPNRDPGERSLFDTAEMALTKAGWDGTKYFQPAYQTCGKKAPAHEGARGMTFE